MIISHRIDVFADEIVVPDGVGSLEGGDGIGIGNGNGDGDGDGDADDNASGGDDGDDRNVDGGRDDDIDDIWWSICRQSLYKKSMLSVLVSLDP